MANQNDTFDIRDLDLSNVEGFEGFGDDTDDAPVEEPVSEEPIESVEEVDDVEDVEEVEDSEDDEPISWSYIESIVPEPLHEDLKPLVEDWQRRYQRVIEETEPLRQFAERGLTEADISAALQVQEALIKDPRRFYDGLAETYGWGRDSETVASLQKQIEETQRLLASPGAAVPQNQEQAFEDYFSWDQNQQQQAAPVSQQESMLAKQLMETQQRLEQMEQAQQAAEQQRLQQEQLNAGRAQLENELSQLEQKYGQIDRQEIVKRAIANAHAGNNPSVSHAFHELRDYEESLRRRYAAKRPPKVVGSGTGMSAPAPADLSTDEAKREAALALAVRLGSQT